MRWAQVTDTGLVRTSNEDNLRVVPDLAFFAVADGMGGHRAGEVASGTALQVMERELIKRLGSGEEPGSALSKAVKEANRSILELSGRNPELAGMGTTITACLATRANELLIGQVGDSRAYLIRGDGIVQLTEDHSLVQELVRNGGISEEQAFVHPQRNVLTRAVGTDYSLEVDLYRVGYRPGDLLLLCTDGLTGYLRPPDLLLTVRSAPDLEAAVQALLEKALRAGGNDNITIILVELS